MGACATTLVGPSVWKPRPIATVAAALVLAACGGPSAPSSPGTDGAASATAAHTNRAKPAAAPAPRSIVDTIPTTWGDLTAMAHRIYVGRWIDSPRAGASYCVRAERVVHGPPALRAKDLCLLHRTPFLDGASWAAPPTPRQAWVLTTMVGGTETLTSAAGTKKALLEKVKCGMLDRVWQRMPPAHQRCTKGADCRMLQSMCFTKPVAAKSAAPYLQVLRRFGGTCLDPVGGACPRSRAQAVCRQNLCTTGGDP